jgi:hypothetical protein
MKAMTLPEHLASWAVQKEQRPRLDDQLERPRELDHQLFFRKRSGAKTAAQALTAAGFRVSIRPGLLRTTLDASRDDPLTDADVARVLAEVAGIADANGGQYDGFGGTVVPASVEA